MSTTDTKRIVTTLDADITPMQAKIKALQADIDKLEKSIVKIATKELGNQTPYNSLPALQRTLSHSPDIRDALPQLAPLLSSLDTAVKQMNGLSRLSANPNAGFTSYDGVAKGGPTPETPREEAIRGLTVQRASALMQAQVDALTKQAKGDDDLRRKKSELVEQEKQQLLRTVFNARSLSQLGALATGNAGPIGRNLAFAGIQYAATGRTNMGGAFQSGLSAIKLLRGPNNGTSASAIDAAGGVAPAAEDAAGGISALRFLGPIGAAIGAAVLGTAYLDKVRTQARVVATDLRASIPGANSAAQNFNLEDKLGGVQGTALQYLYSSNSGFSLGHQLGQAGVGAGRIAVGTQNTFSLARAIGADESQIPSLGYLTGTLMGKQGKSGDETAMVFQQLVKSGKAFGVSIDKLIDSFSTLEQTTNGVALSATGIDSGISGLAAVQRLVGGNINAGSLLSPAMGATGASAIQGAALLFGGDMQKFINAQGHPDQMFDAIGRFVKSSAPANNPMAREVDIQMFKQMGLLGLDGLAPQDQRRVMNLLMTGDGKQAQDLAQKLQKSEDLVSPQAWRQSMISAANEQVTYAKKIQLNAAAAEVTLGTIHNDLVDIYAAVGQGAGSSDVPANDQQRAQLTPGERTMQALGQSTGFRMGQKTLAAMGYTTANVGNVPFDLAGIPTSGPYGVQPVQNGYLPRFNGPHPAGSVEVPNFNGEYIRVPPQMMASFVAATNSKAINPNGVPLSVLLAMAAQESGFHADASNGSHFGIGQFDKNAIATITSDPSSPFYRKKFDPFNASQAIPAMEWFLNYKIRNEKGNMAAGIADYGEGPSYAASAMKEAKQVEIVVTGTLKVADTSGNHAGTVTIPPHHVRTPVADSKTKAHPAKAGPHGKKPPPKPPNLPIYKGH